MTDNEQRAHDIALLFIKHDIDRMNGKEIVDEELAIKSNATNKNSGKNHRTSSVLDKYENLYREIKFLLS